ncbi:MAG: saccharopine dehydrogenase NADP-binding domain-containing protein [Bacteroidetes bacterium]|nr:saccharopine dehydrogenase NADP-binding domain-containing protein [Bacteroidota bacterium]
MKKIFVIGAGLSSSYLIKYLKEESTKQKGQWYITIGDADIKNAESKAGGHAHCTAIAFDINNKEQREKEISAADIVVSLLPPTLHIRAANDCLKFKKHLVTASYISKEMFALDKKVKQAGVLFLNEIGLDPGIDHLSAMKMIHDLKEKGAEITGFKSYCGGLVSKKFDNNPWHYKFTWNPRNVVTAGQGTAKYLHKNQISYIPPSRIFTEISTVEQEFDAYLNRDSVGYIIPYGLEKAETVLRGTLRIKGYCKAWNVLVQLGLTDDTYIYEADNISLKKFTNSFLPKGCKNLKQFVVEYLHYEKGVNKILKQLEYLELASTDKLISKVDTPANILLSILKDKWKLEPNDLDRIVMIHYIDYVLGGKKFTQKAFLEVEGESQQLTAMAKTVGLPMGIAVKLILSDKIKARGVQMPLTPEFYIPILKELEAFDVRFIES